MIKIDDIIDVENIVIGTLLIDNEAVESIIDILTPQCFYSDKNRVVFDAILTLYKNNKPIDLIMVTQQLKSTKNLDFVGGAYEVVKFTDRVASSVNIEYHARIVLQSYLKRKLTQISQDIIKDSQDETKDVFDVYSSSIAKLEDSINQVVKYDVAPIGSVHEKVIQESIRVTMSGQSSGVPSGFYNIDNFTNGWQKTDLIIVAGRTSMGKSVTALSFALNPALRNNIPTAIFNLEMSNAQLVGRTQSVLSGVDSSKIIKKQLTLEEIDLIDRSCVDLKNAPIYIDDTPSLSLLELKNKARKLVKDKGVQLIIVDYLQLMSVETNKNMNRELEVSTISKGLKNLAKELDIPIIALSQLNRAVEGRSDKKPILSDLRESGSIEQDADMVIFCYRPEYYNIPTYELGGEQMPTDNLMVLIVAKHRAGQLGELRLGFDGSKTKLENYESMMNRKRQENNPFEDEPISRLRPNTEAEDMNNYNDDNPF